MNGVSFISPLTALCLARGVLFGASVAPDLWPSKQNAEDPASSQAAKNEWVTCTKDCHGPDVMKDFTNKSCRETCDAKFPDGAPSQKPDLSKARPPFPPKKEVSADLWEVRKKQMECVKSCQLDKWGKDWKIGLKEASPEDKARRTQITLECRNLCKEQVPEVHLPQEDSTLASEVVPEKMQAMAGKQGKPGKPVKPQQTPAFVEATSKLGACLKACRGDQGESDKWTSASEEERKALREKVHECRKKCEVEVPEFKIEVENMRKVRADEL